jgi:amino-acid N-acetyltransferase
MHFDPALVTDEAMIKELLNACDLPIEDITPLLLEHFFVLREESGIIGVVGLEIPGKCALLRSLGVAEPSRGKGLGWKLTLKAEEHARSRNVETLYLLTTTAEDFFEKVGYEKVDRGSAPTAIQNTAEFRSSCPSTATCMVKHLEPL